MIHLKLHLLLHQRQGQVVPRALGVVGHPRVVDFRKVVGRLRLAGRLRAVDSPKAVDFPRVIDLPKAKLKLASEDL
jgi:hypothetical protein